MHNPHFDHNAQRVSQVVEIRVAGFKRARALTILVYYIIVAGIACFWGLR